MNNYLGTNYYIATGGLNIWLEQKSIFAHREKEY